MSFCCFVPYHLFSNTTVLSVALPSWIGLARCESATLPCFSRKFMRTRRPAFPHSFLSDSAVQCSVRTSPLRYWDSPELRHRCRQRSFCADLELRRQLSLAVHRTRRHEKQEWKRNLLFRAACGDWAARRLLTRKGHSSLVVTRPLLGKCSQQAAVELTMWGSILTSGFRILVSH